ncbi:hypothetical protein AB7M74_010779 [Bradyrhizobium japonicum]
MSKRSWIWLSFGLVIIIGLAVTVVPLLWPHKVQVNGFPPLAYPDFQTWPTPRTFDPPGTVFVLDGTYLDYRATLGVTVKSVGSEEFATFNATGKWTGSMLANFLGFVSQSIESASNLDVNVSAEKVQRWRADPAKLDVAIKAWVVKNKLPEVFVVTEAISVRKLRYLIGSSTGLTSASDVQPRKDSAAEIAVKKNDDGKWVLEGTYKHPHYLFYRVKRVTFSLGLNEPQITASDVDAPLRWTEETVPANPPRTLEPE